MFQKQLNKNIEAYVDDVVVKTRNSDTLVADLEETFSSLQEYSWKLNPNKCVKDVQKFTGCMAALNRFISKLGERGLPFFKLIKH
jgi:hypothetical protein